MAFLAEHLLSMSRWCRQVGGKSRAAALGQGQAAQSAVQLRVKPNELPPLAVCLLQPVLSAPHGLHCSAGSAAHGGRALCLRLQGLTSTLSAWPWELGWIFWSMHRDPTGGDVWRQEGLLTCICAAYMAVQSCRRRSLQAVSRYTWNDPQRAEKA